MTILTNIFCLIGITGIVVFGVAFAKAFIANKPLLTTKKYEELVKKYKK